MPESLFREDERYNEAGLELDKRSQIALFPLFQEFEQRGYSIRDIALVLSHCVDAIEGEAILSKNSNAFLE